MDKLTHYHFSWIVSFQKQRYSHLKEEAQDRIGWRNRFGGGCGPVVWQITDDDDDDDDDVYALRFCSHASNNFVYLC
jgi:hypothetical protein